MCAISYVELKDVLKKQGSCCWVAEMLATWSFSEGRSCVSAALPSEVFPMMITIQY